MQICEGVTQLLQTVPEIEQIHRACSGQNQGIDIVYYV